MAMAVLLGAGLEGVRSGMEPPESVDQNIYEMSLRERRSMGIEDLPASLKEALDALADDKVIQSALGSHIYKNFVDTKEAEWNMFRTTVHPWEREQYMKMY